MVTSVVILSKRKISKKRILGFWIVLFGSRIDVCLVSTKSRVTKTFWKIRPPLFSSSGNQSFRYTVRFTSILSFKCSYVRAISLAFAHFSFTVCSFEFVSWSTSCCQFGLVRVQFMYFCPSFPSICSHRHKFFPLSNRFLL